MMVLKITLVFLTISGCYGADILDNMNEIHDVESKATACVWDNKYATLRSCKGVLWRRSSLVVRATCLRFARDPYVQKGIANCTRSNLTASYSDDEPYIRYVTAIYMHPQYPTTDLALLRLNAPYSTKICTFNHNFERKLDEWEKFIVDYYTISADGNIQIRHYQMYTTPIKMIFITVILPTLSFALFFFYVIFYTGSPEKDLAKDIPYKNLANEDECISNI